MHAQKTLGAPQRCRFSSSGKGHGQVLSGACELPRLLSMLNDHAGLSLKPPRPVDPPLLDCLDEVITGVTLIAEPPRKWATLVS